MISFVSIHFYSPVIFIFLISVSENKSSDRKYFFRNIAVYKQNPGMSTHNFTTNKLDLKGKVAMDRPQDQALLELANYVLQTWEALYMCMSYPKHNHTKNEWMKDVVF